METVARDHKLSCPWKQGWSCQHVSGWLSLHHPSSDPGSWKEVKEGGRGHKKSQERRPKYGIELRCTADSTGRSTVTAKGWELSSHSFQIYVNSNTGFLIFDATRYTFCTLDIQILCIIEIVYTWEDFFHSLCKHEFSTGYTEGTWILICMLIAVCFTQTLHKGLGVSTDKACLRPSKTFHAEQHAVQITLPQIMSK